MENDQLTVSVDFWKEGDVFVAHCHSLEIASYGETLEEAKDNFSEALKLFYESCKDRGVLQDALLECGWVKDNREKLMPPKRVGHLDVPVPEAI